MNKVSPSDQTHSQQSSNLGFYLSHPAGTVARGIEKMSLLGHNSNNAVIHGCCQVLGRAVALTVLPAFAGLELVFKKIPKAAIALGTYKWENREDDQTKFSRRCDKIAKYGFCLLFTPLGLHSADAISFFFLKRPPHPQEIMPFGVEKIFGLKLNQNIMYPKTEEGLLSLVKTAKEQKKQISLIGAGFSQGWQTIPINPNYYAVSLKHLNQVVVNKENNTVTAGAGASWEKIQIALNKEGKSVLVKQASDPFSIGGSIGINCHGWAHQEGPLSNTVTEIKVINGKGKIQTLKESDNDFKLYFGTLGYFGIVLSATLRITDNELLSEVTTVTRIDYFMEEYKPFENDRDIPLFGGRLSLETSGDHIPLQEVCLEKFRRMNEAERQLGMVTPEFAPEWKKGTRMQRIGLHLLSNLSFEWTEFLITRFWRGEKKSMTSTRTMSRNEVLHPPINVYQMFTASDLHAQWLQEYFIKPEKLVDFIKFLGPILKENQVTLINATIRPTPEDRNSILPYATKGGRMAVVIAFDQFKTDKEIAKTKAWIEKVNTYLAENEGIYYQAYMPWATKEQFETCYGKETVAKMRELKKQKDPQNLFGNAHTRKYFDE